MVQSLLESHFPLVLFDREGETTDSNTVLVENKKAMGQLIYRLIKLGCKKIGLVTITPSIYTLELRIDGYKKTLEENGLPVDEHLIRYIGNKSIKEDVANEIPALLDQYVDAIVFTNNQTATHGLWYLNMHQKQHVDSLRIACFDDLELFDYTAPKVISVAQPIKEMAEKIFELMIHSLQHPEDNYRNILLKTNIIDRINHQIEKKS